MTDPPPEDVSYLTNLFDDDVQRSILEALAKDLEFDEIVKVLLSRERAP